MRILILDTKNQVIENISRYQGTVNSSVLRAAEIFRPAIIRNCPGVLICHNHPSGDPTPSPEDVAVTEQLVSASRVLDIELVDHLVIGNHRFCEFEGEDGVVRRNIWRRDPSPSFLRASAHALRMTGLKLVVTFLSCLLTECCTRLAQDDMTEVGRYLSSSCLYENSDPLIRSQLNLKGIGA